MNEKTVMLIAGQSGSKSTFAGGLLHHIEKEEDLSIVDTVKGDRYDYDKRLIEPMFSKGVYPYQTENGYIVDFDVSGDSFARPKTQLTFIDIPGEYQREVFQPEGKKRLMLRLRDGEVPPKTEVIREYETNLRGEFERGNTPDNPDDWETTVLYHLYNADDILFLLNIHKIVEQNEQLAYDKPTIEWTVDHFTDVAVVPTAVDLVGYDPDSYDPTLLERILTAIITPETADDALIDTLKRHISKGVDSEARNVIEYADLEPEVDFFGVSVPAKQRGQNDLDDDGSGGFVVKGFETTTEWLEK